MSVACMKFEIFSSGEDADSGLLGCDARWPYMCFPNCRPEDGDDMILRKVPYHIDHTASETRIP
jgi:hypothetical protein